MTVVVVKIEWVRRRPDERNLQDSVEEPHVVNMVCSEASTNDVVAVVDSTINVREPVHEGEAEKTTDTPAEGAGEV